MVRIPGLSKQQTQTLLEAGAAQKLAELRLEGEQILKRWPELAVRRRRPTRQEWFQRLAVDGAFIRRREIAEALKAQERLVAEERDLQHFLAAAAKKKQ